MTEPESSRAARSTNRDEADRLARVTRFGPHCSLAGVVIWVLVIAAYLFLGVTESAPGDPINPVNRGRFLLTFILLAFGIFWGTTLAGLGFALGLLELKCKTGLINKSRARLGIGLGILGDLPMFLTIFEIVRVSMR